MDEQKDNGQTSDPAPPSEPVVSPAVATSEPEMTEPRRKLLQAIVSKLHDPQSSIFETPTDFGNLYTGTLRHTFAAIDGADGVTHFAISSYDSRDSTQDQDYPPGQDTRFRLNFWNESTNASGTIAVLNRPKGARQGFSVVEVHDGERIDKKRLRVLRESWLKYESSGYSAAIPLGHRNLTDDEMLKIADQLQQGSINLRRTQAVAQHQAQSKGSKLIRGPMPQITTG